MAVGRGLEQGRSEGGKGSRGGGGEARKKKVDSCPVRWSKEWGEEDSRTPMFAETRALRVQQSEKWPSGKGECVDIEEELDIFCFKPQQNFDE
eukprot:751498-Hanusia_phi.AAC.2